MGRSSGETDREVGQKHKGRQDMRVKYLSRKFSEAFESHNAWRKTRKHKSKTEELAEFHQIETAQSIAQTHKLNDVVLDFSSDPKINATRFTEIYKNALIKANPRSNPSVIKSLINCKWKEFRINQTEKEQKSSNEPEIKKPRTRKAILLNELENKKFTPKKAKGKLTLKDQSNSESSSEHNDLCEFCEKPGEVLLCDSCSASYHLSCVNMKESDVPDGEWNCPLCVKEILAQPQKVEKAKIVKESKPEGKIEDESCYHCSKAGTQLICNTCLKFFHIDCTFPPLKSKPIKWKCQYCKAPELENPIEKIFFWKYVDLSIPSSDNDDSRQKTYTVKKFLVKYMDYSYWEVSWIDEFQIKAHSFPMYVAFSRKFDMTIPMYLDDGDTLPDRSDPIIDLENISETDLYKTFYIYGIKPEWLQIHRIISVQKTVDGVNYLVKWRDLPHLNSTWESRHTKFIRKICNIKKHIIDFNNNIREAMERPQMFSKSSLKSFTYQPYTTTPEFLLQNLNLSLHPYQLEGLNWIRYSCFNDTNVILADEMGLGKTIQSIVFLYSLYKEKLSPGPFLVCAPLSTLPNWEREFEIWAPDLYVVLLSMSRENRDFIKEEEFYLKKCSPKLTHVHRKNLKFHVLLVSYEVAQIEIPVLKSIKWSVLVLDEAHRIKNKQSKLHQTLADYRFQFKLLLTGTPLQNNLEELFYLLNFLSSKEFSNAEDFLQEFKDLNKEAQIDKIHKLLGKRLLRRLKSDVLKDIPIKSEVIVPIDLCPLQRKYYRAILNKSYSTLVQKGNTSSSLLNVLMELKKCCNHPFLFHLNDDEEPFDEESGLHTYENLISGSAKMLLLEKMLVGLHKGGHRVLIFSQMTKLLNLVEEYLNHKDWKYERIDGTISTLNRQASIDRFNSKDSQSWVFLLSTRAGGLGINLATADTVIIYDSDWNPHNDIQALSRAHRLGQLKKVMIYRFVTRNSVEERILEVAKKKMMLTHLVVHSGLSKNENLSKRELDDILKFGTAQLFSNTQAETDKLEYNDEAIEKLLNREIHSTQVTESGINEYFSSFKVTDCAVRQPIHNDPSDTLISATESTQYWHSILNGTQNPGKEENVDDFGKGKRLRKQIKYADNEIKEIDEEIDPDYDAAKEQTSSSEESGHEGEVEQNSSQIPKSVLVRKDIIRMPLLTSYSSTLNVEVELRRKKNILNKLITFGLPLMDIQFTYKKWGMENEDNLSVDDFKIYVENIFASLDYTASKFPQFIDKFPLDDSGCQLILVRVATIELIKGKVIQYASQIPYMLPLLVDEHFICPNDLNEDYLTQVLPYLKTNPGCIDNLSHLIQPPQNNKELVGTNSVFMFNIEEHNYTELHIVWEAEQDIRDQNLWWRYHDLWLLLGVSIHGYNQFSEIFADPRFQLLHLAFENSKEDKLGFARRRLDLLEQALLIEDIVKRMIDQKVYLRTESNIIKMKNKIFELNTLLEAGTSISENYNSGKRLVTPVLKDLLNYCQLLCSDIKNDTSQITRYILSSSLRTIQLFPTKADEKLLLKLTLNSAATSHPLNATT